MIRGYRANTIEPRDIIDIGVEECYKVLAEIIVDETIPYTVKELLQNACSKNQPVMEVYHVWCSKRRIL